LLRAGGRHRRRREGVHAGFALLAFQVFAGDRWLRCVLRRRFLGTASYTRVRAGAAPGQDNKP
jgi:hypothetical protein